MRDEGERRESGMNPIFVALETEYMMVPPATKLRKCKKNILVD